MVKGMDDPLHKTKKHLEMYVITAITPISVSKTLVEFSHSLKFSTASPLLLSSNNSRVKALASITN